jgi:AmmeMemoRadiSam system protein A
MTDEATRRALMDFARAAIVGHVTRGGVPECGTPQLMSPRGGAFVTIHHRGTLRGCIGHVEANEPLAMVILRCAVAACSADPRFPPVGPSELNQLTVELSLLGPLEAISGPPDIELGRHGLVVEKGRARGLLLPQVAIEWQWDRETFLAETCRKAGLASDAWRTGARLWRFEAEVFGGGLP